jgi:hypothetical protein
VLDARIRGSLVHFLNGEAHRAQRVNNLFGAEKDKIERHRMAPPVVEMRHLVAQVKGQEQHAARAQYASYLRENDAYTRSRNVNEGVERNDAGPLAIGDVETPHIPLLEHDSRIQSSRTLKHYRRQVDADDGHTAIVEVAGHMPRPAPEIADESGAPNPRCVPIQELTIEGLVIQFVSDAIDVLLGNTVVTELNVVLAWPIHCDHLLRGHFQICSERSTA